MYVSHSATNKLFPLFACSGIGKLIQKADSPTEKLLLLQSVADVFRSTNNHAVLYSHIMLESTGTDSTVRTALITPI